MTPAPTGTPADTETPLANVTDDSRWRQRPRCTNVTDHSGRD
ncbi:MAG: hypothetical protein ACOX0O_08460 [Candidatus Methanoculleus thermohydrogenotrophicum]